MLVIRTAEELTHALTLPLDQTLRDRLEAQRTYLADYADYAFEELCVFAIVQPSDCLSDLNTIHPRRLVAEECFAFDVEAIDRHGAWLELVFILSDDGFGLVLWVPLHEAIDPAIVAACMAQAPLLNGPAGREG